MEGKRTPGALHAMYSALLSMTVVEIGIAASEPYSGKSSHSLRALYMDTIATAYYLVEPPASHKRSTK